MIQDFFQKYDIELVPEEIKKFEAFLEIFQEKNSQINLSAIRDREGIIEKHFIDSVMLNIFLELEGTVADLGTGGGFPLIPLAIINREVQFTGIDSVGKKLKAIDDFTERLGLSNVQTLNGRAEELGQDEAYRGQFNFVTSRATAYMPTLLEYTLPLLKIGGIFIAYKIEDKEELKASKKALARLGGKIIKIKNYQIGEQKRTFIFIEKIAATHRKYPRNIGIPLQKPL